MSIIDKCFNTKTIDKSKFYFRVSIDVKGVFKVRVKLEAIKHESVKGSKCP